jgi:hypothetical protein
VTQCSITNWIDLICQEDMHFHRAEMCCVLSTMTCLASHIAWLSNQGTHSQHSHRVLVSFEAAAAICRLLKTALAHLCYATSCRVAQQHTNLPGFVPASTMRSVMPTTCEAQCSARSCTDSDHKGPLESTCSHQEGLWAESHAGAPDTSNVMLPCWQKFSRLRTGS